MLFRAECEQRLILAAKHGEPADFSDLQNEHPGPSVRAEVIRAVLLGLPVPPHHQIVTAATSLTIRGLTIEGSLNLSAARGPGGGPIAALDFDDCVFEDRICLDHSHIPTLRLRDCKIAPSKDPEVAEISLHNARIDGDLTLTGVNSHRPCGPFRIEAIGIHVDGNIWISNSSLLAPANEKLGPDRQVLRYALNLTNSVVTGDVRLYPDVEINGGMSISSAHIQGDVWIVNAQITDGEDKPTRETFRHQDAFFRDAINGQSARVEGNFFLRELSPVFRRQLTITGDIWLMAISVDGVLHIAGASVRLGDVRLAFATLGGRTTLEQLLVLDGNLLMDGIRSGGELFVQGRIRKNLSLVSGSVGGNAVLAVTVGPLAGANLDQDGSVNLTGCQIAGDLDMNEATCAAVEARDLHVEGNSVLSLHLLTRINLHGAIVKGNLNHLGLEFDVYEEWGTLELAGAQIGRTLKVSKVPAAEERYDLKVEALRQLALGCYPGYSVLDVKLTAKTKDPDQPPGSVELIAKQEPLGWVGFIAKDGDGTLLDGNSSVFHKLNSRGALRLSSHDAVKEYLKLFCSYVWGEDGPFVIVEGNSEVPEIPEGIEIQPVRIEQAGPLSFEAKADIRYGSGLFRAELAISAATGKVEMKSDALLASLRPADPPRYKQHYRRFDNADFGNDRDWRDLSSNDLKTILPQWQTRAKRFSGTYVDLRGASCGTLDDSDGTAWGARTELLQLDNFTYERIEARETAASPFTSLAPYQAEPGLSAKKEPLLRRVLTYCSPDARLTPKIANRLRWLPKGPLRYRPQPYTHLAKTLRDEGDYDGAKHIEARKLREETGKLTWSSLPAWLFYLFFNYGYAPWRAAGTLFLCILLGWAGVCIANQRHMLALETTPVASVAIARGTESVAATQVAGPVRALEELPCGDAISPLIYAADVFIPLLDLRQETRCDIAVGVPYWSFFWQLLKSLYAALGWLVTTLAVLTLSGVLRRWVESRD